MIPRWGIVAFSTVAAIGMAGSFVLPSVVQKYVSPMLEQKINSSLLGSASYENLSFNWYGDVVVDNLSVYDQRNKLFLSTPRVTIDIDFWELTKSIWQNEVNLTIISELNLEQPSIFLREYEQSTWNLQYLAKEEKDSKELSFRGKVVINDGKLDIFSKIYSHSNISSWNGVFDFAGYSTVKGATTFNWDGEALKTSGEFDFKTSNFSLFLESSTLTNPIIKEILNQYSNIKIEDFRINDISLTIKQGEEKIALDGKLSLENIQGQYENYHWNHGQADIRFDGDTVIFDQGRVDINGETIAVSGRLFDFNRDKKLDVKIIGDEIRIDSFPQLQPVKGVATVELFIQDKLSNPKITGFIKNGDITFENYHFEKARANFTYQSSILQLTSLHSQLSDGAILGDGWYDSVKNDFVLTVKGSQLPFYLLGLDADIQGRMNGEVSIRGENGHLAQVKGIFNGDNLFVKGVGFDNWKAQVISDGNGYFVPTLQLQMNEGTIISYGHIDENQIYFNYQGTDIPIERLKPIIITDVKGQGTIIGTVTGSLKEPKISADVAVKQGRLGHIPFELIKGNIVMDKGVVTLSDGYWHTPEGGHEFYGSMNLDSRLMNFTIKSQHVRLEDFSDYFPVYATGWLDNEISITGFFDNPIIKGQAHMHHGSVAGELITEAYADYQYANERLDVRQATINAYNSQIIGQGHWKKGELDFTFSGEDIDVERIIRDDKRSVFGRLSIKGRIQGDEHRLIFNGSVKSPLLYVNDLPLTSLEGKVYYDPTVLSIQEFSFHQGEGKYKVRGGLTIPDDKLFGTITADNVDLQGLLKISGTPVRQVDGRLYGKLELGGTLTEPDIEVKGDVNDVLLGNQIVGTGKIDASFNKNKLTIKTLKLPILEGVLAAKGTVDFSGETDVQIAAKQVPLELLTPIISDDKSLFGKVDLLATVKGKTNNPVAEMSLTVNGGNYKGIAFDNLFGLINVKDGIINLNQVLLSKGEYKATAYGKLPLVAFYKDSASISEKSKMFDVAFNFDDADLGLLPLVTPLVKEAHGDTQGKIYLKGTYENPLIAGELAVDNGTILFKDNKSPVEQLKGNIVFSGKEALLKSQALMGAGKLDLNGKATWYTGVLDSYELKIQAKELQIDSPYYKGALSGELSLNQTGEMPVLSGVIDVNKATFDIPLVFEKEENKLALGLDVSVNMGEQARLYNNLLYDVNLSGEVHFGGTTIAPSSRGTLQVNGGTVKYLNTKFNLNPGMVKFNRPHSFLPNLELKGQTHIREYTIKMSLTGPVDELNLKLTADPYLEERQIISLLTLKGGVKNSSQVNASDINALLTAGLEMTLFSGVESTLQDNLGLDLVNITTGSLDPYETTNKVNQGYYNIEIGKYLFPNFMVSIAKGVNNDLTVYSMKYELGSRLSLKGWINNNGHSYIGGQWRLRF